MVQASSIHVCLLPGSQASSHRLSETGIQNETLKLLHGHENVMFVYISLPRTCAKSKEWVGLVLSGGVGSIFSG